MIFKDETRQRIVTGTILASFLIPLYLFAQAYLISLFFLVVLIFILLFEWPLFKIWWLTPLYPIISFIFLILLNQSTTRILLPLLFITVFSNDMGAYVAGKLWGKHKIAPYISPGKTWEGFIGGCVATIMSLFIFLYFQHAYAHVLIIVFAGVVLSTAGTIGDFFESYLKRRARLKDSGTTLPGHGGWLDRFDGILAAVMIIYPLRHTIMYLLDLT